jgi:hypothetical protein
MRVFKEKAIARWAAAEAIDDATLCLAAAEAFAGLYDADLGGYLFKKRIARQHSGKSGGYRTILGFRKANAARIVFVFGFPKNAKANISAKEREALSKVAVAFVNADDNQVMRLKAGKYFVELECGS